MSMKEDRAREGKKARYRKMGFGPAMDRGDIDFKDKHPLTKKRLKNFKKKDDSPMSDERFYQQRKAQINKAGVSTKKMLTGGQAKIAAKAPPPNKLDEKDFAVLRAEKAKGRGMGLQDESVKPGKVQKAALGMLALGYMGKKYLDKKKTSQSTSGGAGNGKLPINLLEEYKKAKGLQKGGVMKYKRGSGLDLPVISSVKPTVNKSKRAQNLSKMKLQFNKQRSRAGINPNSLKKVLMKTKNPYSDLVKTTDAGPKKYSSMAEMRKAKGFKPGESASEFNKRRMKLAGVAKAASATKIGKIALGIGAIGLGAKKYLESKMKKKEVKKKMGGGMMKKYSEGMSYKDMAPYGGKYAKIKKDMRDTASENVKRLTTQSDAYDPETRYVTASQRKGNSRRRRTTKTTDQVYLQGVANKMKQDMGSGTSTSILTPSQARDRRIIKPERRRALKKERGAEIGGEAGFKFMVEKKKKRMSKKMGGGMMQRPMGYSKGGGYDSGNPGKLRDIVTKYAGKFKSKDRLTNRDIETANKILKGGRGKALRGTQEMISRLKKMDTTSRMGGGMMNKPMGYKSGTMVKARGCKLGRNKPTKIT